MTHERTLHRRGFQRRAGYRSALKAAGIPIDPDLEAHGTFTIEGGDEATVQCSAAVACPLPYMQNVTRWQ